MSLADDLRLAARTLAKRPLFTLVVVVTLGLSIGANSAIFSVVNAALFAPLGVRAPDELVNIYTVDSTGSRHGASSYPDFLDLRQQSPGLSGLIGYSGLMTTVTGDGAPEVLFGEMVTGNYFSMLGVPLALGRGFLPEEDATPGSPPVAVLGHGLWLRRFGGDSSVVGRTIVLNGHPFTVIGVAPSRFKGLLFRGLVADLWAPVMMMGQLRTDHLSNRGERWLFVKGRLASGATVAQTAAVFTAIGSRLSEEYPATNRGRSFSVLPTEDVAVHPDGDRFVLPGAAVVLLLVGLVLLIAFTNLANLMLARAVDRRREIAVRIALGATRTQLVRQLASESLLLAGLGGLAGLALAGWFARGLIAFRPPIPVPISLAVGIDGRVVLFTVLASALACAVFGLAPALQAARASYTPALAGADPESTRRRRIRPSSVFLLPQLALSLVLLIVAGLFVRSIGNAGRVDPGFDLEHTATIALDLRLDGFTEPEAKAFYEDLARRVSTVAGIQGVTLTDRVPLDLYGSQAMTVSVPSLAGGAGEQRTVQFARADTGYFGTLGVPIVQGRKFTADEVMRNAPVVMVSSYTAGRFWPDANPLGRRIRLEDSGAMAEVIGVAGDTKVQTLGERPEAFVYRPFDGRHARLLRFIARGSGAPDAMVEKMRRAVSAINPRVAIFEARTMSQQLDVMLFPYRMAAGVSSALGLFGLLLAAVGLYGVVAFGVARRTREFGIRMALGARAVDVIRLVVGESMRVVGAGLVLGLVLALAIARLLAGVLFGIAPGDPLTMIGIPILLALVTLAASVIPARRATRVNPSVALRQD